MESGYLTLKLTTGLVKRIPIHKYFPNNEEIQLNENKNVMEYPDDILGKHNIRSSNLNKAEKDCLFQTLIEYLSILQKKMSR